MIRGRDHGKLRMRRDPILAGMRTVKTPSILQYRRKKTSKCLTGEKDRDMVVPPNKFDHGSDCGKCLHKSWVRIRRPSCFFLVSSLCLLVLSCFFLVELVMVVRVQLVMVVRIGQRSCVFDCSGGRSHRSVSGFLMLFLLCLLLCYFAEFDHGWHDEIKKP